MSRRSRDIDGQVFGKLTVVRFDHVKNKRQYYLCRCECGKEKVILKGNLLTGKTTSCGCNRRKNPPKETAMVDDNRKGKTSRSIDLTGQKFNKWKVESLAYVKGYDKYYNCVCECGTRKVVLGQNLKNGKSKSCGCGRHKQAHNFVDRTGQRYNNLVCLEYEKRDGYIYWKCLCDCGNTTWVRGENLVSGAVKSCGCARDHVNRVHGMSHTRIHSIWSRLFQRCYNPKSDNYEYYGGRGIKVCDEWHGTDGFMKFQEWAMANGYSDKLTIDRIDVNGDYEPSNCRWADKLTQANNTRSNHYLTYEGETHSIAEWARIKNMDYATLAQRITKLGWSLERAFTEESRTMEKLTEENYYSPEMNMKYCSASQLKQFIGSPIRQGCEARAMAEIRGEWKQETTKALLQGSILDALWENDDPDYIMSRFPECISSRGATKGQLKSEYQDAIAWYQLTLKSKKFCEYMGGEKQVIMTGNIEGLPFKIKIDSYHPDRAIVDLKTTKTLDRDYRIFIPDSGERLPFYEAYGYPLQLAIYREVVRQNTGYVLPCYLACVDKHTHPICDIIQISDGRLDDALEEVKRNCENVIALKSGEIEPIRCEHSDCDYCRDTHECQLISDEEFEAHDIEKGAV